MHYGVHASKEKLRMAMRFIAPHMPLTYQPSYI